MPPTRFPFITEIHSNPVGYPNLKFFFQGILWEGLLDTGCDNVLGGLEFLRMLEQKEVVNIEEILESGKCTTCSGIGGNIVSTPPIKFDINILMPDGSELVTEISATFALTHDIQEYQKYLQTRAEAEKKSDLAQRTTDTYLRRRLDRELQPLREFIQAFNPPFLLGKSFMSKFKYINFVINDESAQHDSFYEFEFRPECIKKTIPMKE